MQTSETRIDTPKTQESTDGPGGIVSSPARTEADARRDFLALVGVAGAALVAGCEPATIDGESPALGADDDIVGVRAAAATSTSLRWADTVAELSNLNGSSAMAVIVSGYHVQGDGGGGVFTWDADATAAPDNGLVFQPTGTPGAGRWRRLTNGSVNVRWFGVRDNPAADASLAAENSVRLKWAIDAVGANGGAVHFPAGEYVLGNQVHLQRGTITYDNVVLQGEGAKSIVRARQAISTSNSGMIWFDGNGGRIKNVGVRQLHFMGADETTTAGPLVHFAGCEGSFAIDCIFERSAGQAASWTPHAPPNTGIRLSGNHAARVGGFGGSGTGTVAFYILADDVTILGNRTFETGGALFYAGNSAVIADNIFEFCKVGGTDTTAINLGGTQGKRTIVQGNTIRSAGTGVTCSPSPGELLVVANVIEKCTQPISVSGADGALVIRGNYLYDAWTANSAAITYNTTSTSTYVIIDQNTIVRGPTSAWGYAVHIASAGAKALVRKNVVVGAAATGPLFLTHDSNTLTEYIDNIIRPQGALADAFARYKWRGQTYTKAQFVGIDDGTVLSISRSSLLRLGSPPAPGTIPPVLATGGHVWNVGDLITNATPSEQGPSLNKFVVQGWTYVSGSAWREIRNPTGN